MRPAKESDTQRTILDYLERVGIFHWRQNQVPVRGRRFVGMLGVPDIVGILPGGTFLGIECKSGKGKQSKDQLAFQARSASLGAVYILATSVEDVVQGIRGYFPYGERTKGVTIG